MIALFEYSRAAEPPVTPTGSTVRSPTVARISGTRCPGQFSHWGVISPRVMESDIAGRVPNSHAVRRHISRHNGIRGHYGMLADLHPRTDHAMCSQKGTVPDAHRERLRDGSIVYRAIEVVMIV